MSRISETPDGVLETFDWQDVAEDLQERIDKIKDLIKANIRPEYRNGRINEKYLEMNEEKLNILLKLLGVEKC